LVHPKSNLEIVLPRLNQRAHHGPRMVLHRQIPFNLPGIEIDHLLRPRQHRLEQRHIIFQERLDIRRRLRYIFELNRKQRPDLLNIEIRHAALPVGPWLKLESHRFEHSGRQQLILGRIQLRLAHLLANSKPGNSENPVFLKVLIAADVNRAKRERIRRRGNGQ